MRKRCRFYPERPNFNLNLSRHFYCYLSGSHVCVWMWFPTGIKGRKWGRAGTSWCQLIEKVSYLHFTISTNSLASTCYNLNLTQLSTNISPTPTKGWKKLKKNPHRNILNKQIVHSASQALITERKIDWTWIHTRVEREERRGEKGCGVIISFGTDVSISGWESFNNGGSRDPQYWRLGVQSACLGARFFRKILAFDAWR